MTFHVLFWTMCLVVTAYVTVAISLLRRRIEMTVGSGLEASLEEDFSRSPRLPLSRDYWASLPEVSLPLCFLSAPLSQLANYAADLRLYP